MSESESLRTTDHDEIRDWVEERGGHPARVEGTGDDGDAGEDLERIDWDEFFGAFEENDLALVYPGRDRRGRGESLLEARLPRGVSAGDFS